MFNTRQILITRRKDQGIDKMGQPCRRNEYEQRKMQL
jgi:hypothetical protein